MLGTGYSLHTLTANYGAGPTHIHPNRHGQLSISLMNGTKFAATHERVYNFIKYSCISDCLCPHTFAAVLRGHGV